MIVPDSRVIRLGLILTGLVVSLPRAVSGQFITDPYDPWNTAYRSYIYPTAPINVAMPNQARLNVVGGIAPFAPEPIDDPFGRFTSRFGQDYKGLRTLEQQYNQNYRFRADESYYQQMQDRERKYFEALREKDPKKRAELLRKLDESTLKAVRGTVASGTRRGGEVLPGRPTPPRTTRPAQPESTPAPRATPASALPLPGETDPLAIPGVEEIVRDSNVAAPVPSRVLDRSRLLDLQSGRRRAQAEMEREKEAPKRP